MIVMGAGDGQNVTTITEGVSLEPATYKASGAQPGKITIGTNGIATGMVTAISGPLTYNWLHSGVASDYEIYCQVNSGSVDGSSMRRWISLNTDRNWYNFAPQGASSFTLYIRKAGTGTVLTSAQITVQPV